MIVSATVYFVVGPWGSIAITLNLGSVHLRGTENGAVWLRAFFSGGGRRGDALCIMHVNVDHTHRLCC